MATTKGRLALSFVTAALAAGSLFAGSPQETLRVNSAADRLHASRHQLGLDADHAFSLRTSHSDDLGQTHAHFSQFYKGVRVWGGDAIAHVDREGADLPLTNALHKNILLNVTPSLLAGEALAVAQTDLAAKGAFAYAPTPAARPWIRSRAPRTSPARCSASSLPTTSTPNSKTTWTASGTPTTSWTPTPGPS